MHEPRLRAAGRELRVLFCVPGVHLELHEPWRPWLARVPRRTYGRWRRLSSAGADFVNKARNIAQTGRLIYFSLQYHCCCLDRSRGPRPALESMYSHDRRDETATPLCGAHRPNKSNPLLTNRQGNLRPNSSTMHVAIWPMPENRKCAETPPIRYTPKDPPTHKEAQK